MGLLDNRKLKKRVLSMTDAVHPRGGKIITSLGTSDLLTLFAPYSPTQRSDGTYDVRLKSGDATCQIALDDAAPNSVLTLYPSGSGIMDMALVGTLVERVATRDLSARLS